MANMRTLAFQVPEDLFQRIKDYLRRNNMTQKEFVIGLVESEINRDLAAREEQNKASQASEAGEKETLGDEDTVHGEIEDAEEETEEMVEPKDESEGEYLDENEKEIEDETEDEYLGADEEIEETDENAELTEDKTDELDEDEEEAEGMRMGM